MNFKLIYNKMLRMPISKCKILFEQYQKDTIDIKPFSELQQLMDNISHKINTKNMIREEIFKDAIISLIFCTKKRSKQTDLYYEKLKKYPMIIWIELMDILDDKQKLLFLDNYINEIPQMLIETIIINLEDNLQKNIILKYKHKINPEEDTYENFYYSLSNEARKVLDSIYYKDRDIDIIKRINDIDESEIINELEKNKNIIGNKLLNQFIETLLLKTNNLSIINKVLNLLSEYMNNLNNNLFELLVERLKYLSGSFLRNNSLFDDDDDEEYTYLNIYNSLKMKFQEIGLEKTLELLDIRVSYSNNDELEFIILDFINLNNSKINQEVLNKYTNKNILSNIIKKYIEQIENNNYTEEELAKIVENIDTHKKNKVILDNLIESIVACSYLMKNNLIDNKNSSFIKLREKLEEVLYNNLDRDGTEEEKINLNGILHRLIKGTLKYEDLFTIKTYKGLIYLNRTGTLSTRIDEIVNRLTDKQISKLNITPLLRWKKEYLKNHPNKDTTFIERMGLQLLCYFGEYRGKYLLDSNMRHNRMENLFDELNYKDILIDENGNSIINDELIKFLFGKGKNKEVNTCINRLIREEVSEFERYFTDFCNNYYNIKEECNNLLSLKRVVNYYEMSKLPIELKPNEYNYLSALRELNTKNEETLTKAISLLNIAKEREYSTIPKVEGSIGDFTYEILDLKNPLNIAVGYLSHCCFTIDGLSSSALEHALTSRNGRVFVVYYKGEFLTQSWVWRNGDVICFDSVEAGSTTHYAYKDDFNLVDVYKEAAKKMLTISNNTEDELQKVKTITVGKSDFIFSGLKEIENEVARPIEKDVYVYDSSMQWILAGKEQEKPRYGNVGVKYYDKRDKVINIKSIETANIDELTEAVNKISSIKYAKDNSYFIFDIRNFKQLIVGEDWYIIYDKNNKIEVEILNNNKISIEECKKYSLSLKNIISPQELQDLTKEEFVKKLELIYND